MLGSDLMGVGGAKTMTCPFTGQTLCLVPALFPDVAVLHVHRADPTGNCQIDGYPHMDADIARAATRVVVTAEQIVPEAEMLRQADRTVIPGFVVDAVVEAPWGAFPHECYGSTKLTSTSSTPTYAIAPRGRRGARLPRPVRVRPPDLRGVPGSLRRGAARSPGAPRARARRVSCSPAELLAVLAARELRGVTTVFAGVGLPLLAAVVAQKTHTPSLTIVVEGGPSASRWCQAS
jgi:acyl CoA:acetate/3-ketoacid CoA transferase